MEINKEKSMKRYIRNTPERWKTNGYSRLPNVILFDENISRMGLLVYWVLTARTFKGKEACFPSYETIAREAHCAKNTAIKAVRELEGLGLVVVERAHKGSRKRNRYFLPKRIR